MDSCQAQAHMICMLSFSLLVGSKTILATTFLHFPQLHLALKLVEAKTATLSVQSSQVLRAPVFCGLSLMAASMNSPWKNWNSRHSSMKGAACGVSFSAPGLLPACKALLVSKKLPAQLTEAMNSFSVTQIIMKTFPYNLLIIYLFLMC